MSAKIISVVILVICIGFMAYSFNNLMGAQANYDEALNDYDIANDRYNESVDEWLGEVNCYNIIEAVDFYTNTLGYDPTIQKTLERIISNC